MTGDDNETARYLTSYLISRDGELSEELIELLYLNQEKLYEVIKEFFDTLP